MVLTFATLLVLSGNPAAFGSAGDTREETLLESSFISYRADTLRPEILAWGLEGPVNQGLPFVAWANVTDTESGVRNVSLIVDPTPGTETLHELLSNGTHYVGTLPGLAIGKLYSFSILAYDMANNSATSYARTIDMRPVTTTIVDPSVTAPIVVGSSLALMGLVIVVSIAYDRRSSRTV
ncbi:MAG: hypothetical protein C4K49_06770 [Candidatus Thorarchaeota archaeon]|nr:MAG: hypothetical protein C4K49_06770 [Candidatus Thorarchaeota archaeon]